MLVTILSKMSGKCLGCIYVCCMLWSYVYSECNSDFVSDSVEFCLRLHVCVCVYPFVRFGEEEDNGAGPGRDSNPLPS